MRIQSDLVCLKLHLCHWNVSSMFFPFSCSLFINVPELLVLYFFLIAPFIRSQSPFLVASVSITLVFFCSLKILVFGTRDWDRCSAKKFSDEKENAKVLLVKRIQRTTRMNSMDRFNEWKAMSDANILHTLKKLLHWRLKYIRKMRKIERQKKMTEKKRCAENWINCNGNCVCVCLWKKRKEKWRETIEFLGLPPVTRHVNTMSSPSSIGPSTVPFNWWPHRFNTNGYSGGTKRF